MIGFRLIAHLHFSDKEVCIVRRTRLFRISNGRLGGLLIIRTCMVLGVLGCLPGCEQGNECPATTSTGFVVSLECDRTIRTADPETVKVEFRREELEAWTACASSRPGATGTVCAPEGTSDVTAFVCSEHGRPAELVGPRFPGGFIVRAQVGETSTEGEFRLEAHADDCTPSYRPVTVKLTGR